MKKLLLPVIVAMLAGLTSASAATFVNAKKAAKIRAAHVADSVAKHVADSTIVADSVEKAHKAHEAEKAAEEALMTPADSIRAAQNQPTTLHAETSGLPNAADPKHAASPAGHETEPLAKPAGVTQTAKGKIFVPHAVDAVKPETKPAAKVVAPPAKVVAPPATVRAVPVAPPTTTEGAGLPESRFAKIFSTMAPKDAAKILEQMNDNDVRTILSKVSDKQAAAILVAFPAARAAAVSRAEAKPETSKSVAKPDSGKSQKPAGEHK